MSVGALLAAAALFAASGLPRGRLGPALAALAALTGLAGAAMGFDATPAVLDVDWAVPGSRFSVALDALGAAFLVPVLVVPALGAVYGQAYFPAGHPTFRRTRFAYGLLPASMVLIVLARDAFLFLVAWEAMALSAFFLLCADDHDPVVAGSGWVYLVATHLGSLCLVAAFAMLAHHAGGLGLVPVRGLPPQTLNRVALLLLVGFGMKAGIMPLHFWLPGAHANAPSHVSAVMSGVVLNMGLYGLLRMGSLLEGLGTGAGGVLLALGAASAVLGAVFAVAQSDVKRLLAYSSVDNMAIAVVGLGLAVIGRATGRADLLVLGVAGGVWHVWNHSLFKSLLFLSAGSVVHATGTRRMDLMGGLARSMPATAAATLVGALALAGLPPLNGFLGETVLYVGLARSASGIGWPALAAPALALTGALAALAMVKLYGGVFLGTMRGPGTPHEPPTSMRVATGSLAAGCVGIVVAAGAVASALDRVVYAFARWPLPPLASLVPLRPLQGAMLATVVGALLASMAIMRVARRRRPSVAGTWDCGYAAPTPRIQYTPTSFSGISTGLFRSVLGVVATRPALRPVFPDRTRFAESTRDPVLDRGAVTLLHRAARAATRMRLVQQGKVHAYVLYILLALLGLLWVG